VELKESPIVPSVLAVIAISVGIATVISGVPKYYIFGLSLLFLSMAAKNVNQPKLKKIASPLLFLGLLVVIVDGVVGYY